MTKLANVTLDICPSYGWERHSAFDTRVISLKNGHERRNANRDNRRRQFFLPFVAVTNQNYLNEIDAIHVQAKGSAHSFDVKDWIANEMVTVRFVSDTLQTEITNRSGAEFVIQTNVELIEVFGE